MGCFTAVQKWWHSRKQAKQTRKAKRKAKKAKHAADNARKNGGDDRPLKDIAPTYRRETKGGLSLTYELAPPRTPMPRSSPLPRHIDVDGLVVVGLGLESRQEFTSSSVANLTGAEGSSKTDYIDLDKLEKTFEENMKAMEVRCRRLRRKTKLLQLFKLGQRSPTISEIIADDMADIGDQSPTGVRARSGGPGSQ